MTRGQHEDVDEVGPDEVDPDEVDPDKVDPDKVDPDKGASEEIRSRHDLGRPATTRGVVTAVLVALACVGTGLLAWAAASESDESDDGDSRRSEALAVAEDAAATLLSYDHARLDENVEAATAHLTPGFALEFREYFTSTVMPLATKYRAVLTTELIASGLERIEEDEATVLLYLDQTTRSSELAAPRVDSSTVEVNLTWVDGEWLVAAVDPI